MKRLVLFGYGEMGSASLEGLSKNFDVSRIILPVNEGGGRFLTPAVEATHDLAKKMDIQVTSGEDLSYIHREIENDSPDGVVVATFNRTIPKRTLELAPFINIHHGDLPRYRGRANINWAIINGRKEIGLTVHEMTPGIDEGGIYHSWEIPINDSDYIADIYEKVNSHLRSEAGDIVEAILNHNITPRLQEGDPTYCCTRLPEDSKIDWYCPSDSIRNLIRASSKPYPGAFSYVNNDPNEKLIIWRAEHPEALGVELRRYEGNIPGRIGRVIKDVGVEVLTNTTPLIITDVQYKGNDLNAYEAIRSTSTTLR